VGDGVDITVLGDDLRCKVIYYSCITPQTISDLNKEWGYSSPTYLYQNNSLEKLKDAGLITVDKDGSSNLIESNYDTLFSNEIISWSREHVNHAILKEFLIHSKGFHPRTEHREDEKDLLQIGRGNLEDELEENLQRLEFSADEFQTLCALWQRPVFTETFLSLENVARLFHDRKDDLPDNPLNFLFNLTAGITAAITRGRSGQQSLDIPPGLQYRTENIIVPTHRALEEYAEQDHDDYDAFVDAMNDVYSLFQSKFQDDRFNYDFIENFVDLTIQDQEERKFNKLFKKYGGGSNRKLF
jgi:hypothetical protein